MLVGGIYGGLWASFFRCVRMTKGIRRQVSSRRRCVVRQHQGRGQGRGQRAGEIFVLIFSLLALARLIEIVSGRR